MFLKMSVLKNFPIFTGKHLCWSLFLIKLQAWRPATILKRDSNTDVSLWIIQKFLRTAFCLEPLFPWLLSTEDLSRIERCDHAMIRWLCNVKIEQKHSTEDLRKRIHVHYIKDIIRWNRLRLFGHLYRQEETSWTKKITSFNVDGPTSRGRPKLRWKDAVNSDLLKKHLDISLPNDRSKWRNAIRPVIQRIALQPTMSVIWRWNDQ